MPFLDVDRLSFEVGIRDLLLSVQIAVHLQQFVAVSYINQTVCKALDDVHREIGLLDSLLDVDAAEEPLDQRFSAQNRDRIGREKLPVRFGCVYAAWDVVIKVEGVFLVWEAFLVQLVKIFVEKLAEILIYTGEGVHEKHMPEVVGNGPEIRKILQENITPKTIAQKFELVSR